MTLSRDDILNSDDLPTQMVEVPEWKGSVLVRGLTGEDRDAWEASLSVRRPILMGPNKGQMESIPDPANANAKLVAKAIVDEAGERLFADSDIIALGKKSAAALTRVFKVAAELSGITEEAATDAEGDSGAGQAGASISESPATSA